MTAKAASRTTEGIVGFQRIDGFGTTVRATTNPDMFGADSPTLSGAQKTALLNFMYDPVNGMGLTTIRTNTREPDDPWTTSAVANPTPTLINRNVSDFLSEARSTWPAIKHWTSPVLRDNWMGGPPTASPVVNLACTTTEYATWILQQVQQMADQGQPLDYVSIVNEPSYWRNRLTGNEMRDVIKNLGPRLVSAGLTSKFVLADDVRASDASSSIAATLADPVARSYVVAIGCHCYDESLSNWTALKATADANRLPLWMTEMSFDLMTTITAGGYTSSAISWAKFVHEMLVTYSVSAVDALWAWFSSDDANQFVTLNNTGNTYTGFTPKDHAYHMGQWSKHVRPGARRVSASATNGALVSAFMSDTSRVIVAVNATASPTSTTITADLLAGRTTMTVTRSSVSPSLQWAALSAQPVSGSTISPTLPANSVTTFVTT